MSPTLPFVSCFLLLAFPLVAPEFIERGSKTRFVCKSQKAESGVMYEPILKRNDDHHKADPVNLFVGSSKRPLVDSDWSVNKTKNETTGIETFSYYLENVDFEDAGIYVCDDIHELKRNLTVLGDRVDCKEAAIETKQGDKIDTWCELPVDGPDEVDLGWYLDDERMESKLKEVKPEDTSVTSILTITVKPELHGKTIQCRYLMDKKAIYTCPVNLDVKYPVQVKGKSKSVLNEDEVEAEIHVIGNPWPGKSEIKVVSDDIIPAKTTLDEIDHGLGAEVTVYVPLSVFEKKKKANVILKTTADVVIGSVDIEIPEKAASTTYIIVIVVLAIAAVLLAVGIIYFVKKNKQRSNKEKSSKDVPLAEQA